MPQPGAVIPDNFAGLASAFSEFFVDFLHKTTK